MSPTQLPVTLIAAVAQNGVIGRDNRMPWRIPGDMAHFRAATMGRPVLMGRRTFESIGSALPGRPVVVASRSPSFIRNDALVVPTIEDALVASDRAGQRIGAPEIMVAGGGAVYAALIGVADTLLITMINLAPTGDTTFPMIDPGLWQETQRIAAVRGTDDEACYAFVRYDRRSPGRQQLAATFAADEARRSH